MLETVKLTSNIYTAFLGEQLSQWPDDIPLSLRFKVVYVHDSILSHAAMAPTSFLESQAIVGETFMTWPPYSPDLSLIENILLILKRGAYEGGEQFTYKYALRNKIV